MLLSDRLLLRKRFLIETITDQLKNISQIEHSRVLDKTAPVLALKQHLTGLAASGPVHHRSPANFAVNLLAGLVAYTLQPKKPAITLPADVPRLPALI